MSDLGTTATETERTRRIYEKTAGRYDRQIKFFERVLFGGGREWACSQAEGETLEIAFGTGRNLRFYPDGVRLSGIELSPRMVDLALERQTRYGHDADLRVGDAQSLDFEDDHFDTVVSTLTLCTIPDPRLAVAEAFRVLRPGGRFVLLEHVRSPSRPVRAVQRALDPLAVRFEADHLLREPLDYLGETGFEIEDVRRLKWGIVERVRARKPTASGP
jgi:ubiquinone/menaquinone biosynthesis C-methylase UbiE